MDTTLDRVKETGSRTCVVCYINTTKTACQCSRGSDGKLHDKNGKEVCVYWNAGYCKEKHAPAHGALTCPLIDI